MIKFIINLRQTVGNDTIQQLTLIKGCHLFHMIDMRRLKSQVDPNYIRKCVKVLKKQKEYINSYQLA